MKDDSALFLVTFLEEKSDIIGQMCMISFPKNENRKDVMDNFAKL